MIYDLPDEDESMANVTSHQYIFGVDLLSGRTWNEHHEYEYEHENPNIPDNRCFVSECYTEQEFRVWAVSNISMDIARKKTIERYREIKSKIINSSLIETGG